MVLAGAAAVTQPMNIQKAYANGDDFNNHKTSLSTKTLTGTTRIDATERK